MAKLFYFKQTKPDGRRMQVTYDEAYNSLLGTYRDSDMTRDMLTIPNNIICRYSTIYVEDHSNPKMPIVLMSGLFNQLPMEYEYDDDGNRIN